MVQDTSLNLPLFALLVRLSLLPPHVPLCFSSFISPCFYYKPNGCVSRQGYPTTRSVISKNFGLVGTNKHILVSVFSYSFRGISTIQATSRLLGTPGHIHIMSENKSTGAPRWKEQLEAALKNDDADASNCIFHILPPHSNHPGSLL